MTSYVTVYMTMEQFARYRNVGMATAYLIKGMAGVTSSREVELSVPLSFLVDTRSDQVPFDWVDNKPVKPDYRVELNRMKDVPEGRDFR